MARPASRRPPARTQGSPLRLLVVVLLVLAGCAGGPGGATPTAPATPRPIQITQLEVLSAESFPVQIFVHVKGEPPGPGCWGQPVAGEPVRVDATIVITVTSAPVAPPCTLEAWIYEHSFALGSDFATGEYRVRVNDVEETFRYDSGIGP